MGFFSAVIESFKQFASIISSIFDLDFSAAFEKAKGFGKAIGAAYMEGYKEEVAAQAEDARLAAIEASLPETKRLIARLEAQGKETYNTRKKLLEDELELLEKGSEEYLDKQNEIEILRINQEKKLQEARVKLKEDNQKELLEIEKRGLKELVDDNKKTGDLLINGIIEQNKIALEQYQAGVAYQKEYNERKLKEQERYEENLKNLQIESALSIVDTLSSLNETFAGKSEQAARRAFNIQKALSLAETVISSYSAAQKAYASQLTIPSPDAPIRAAVAAGVAVAAGLARAKAISKQQFDGGVQSAPSSSGGVPSPAPQQSTPQLAQDVTRTRLGANENGSFDYLKVIVTESDITRAQKRVDRIERRATVK